MFVYNPEGFEPTDHLPRHLHPYADCARVLVHLVETARVYHRLHDSQFVPRKAAYLRRLVHKEMYRPIRDALVDANVIELHPHFVVGQKSYGFRIGEGFRTVPFRRFRLTDPAAARRYQRVHAEISPPLADPAHKGLRSWLERLELDYEAASAFLHHRSLPVEELRGKALALEMIRDREFFFKPDLHGRVHTNLTNLWGGFRRFLRFDGECLVNVDIGNSQPLFFGLLVLRLIRSGIGERDCTCSSPSSPSPPPSPFPFHYDAEGIRPDSFANERTDLPPDLLRYLQITQAARFYEHMMKALDIPVNKPNRDAFKQDFFGKVFYCKPNYYTKERKAFQTEFPTVLDHITRLKQDDPRNAPLALQRVEGDFVIGTVCNRILIEAPGTPLWTIHDSVVTTPSKGEYVRRVMLDEFAKLGVSPRLRIEGFGPRPPFHTRVTPFRSAVTLHDLGSGLMAGSPPTVPLTPPKGQGAASPPFGQAG